LGPVDFWALRRLASNCLSVAIEFSLSLPNLTNRAKLGNTLPILAIRDQQSQFSASAIRP
jgi:hypothetical protein